MASKYWIKLYHEMLDDPKIGRLSDNLKWRFVSLLLLAGDLNQGGRLPETEDAAWRLRIDEQVLLSELDQLSRSGLVDCVTKNPLNTYWVIPKFADRQAAMPKAEHMKRLREERKKDFYYHPVTDGVTNGNTDIDIDIESESDKEEEEEKTPAAVFSLFENNFQLLTPNNSEMIRDDIEEYTAPWVYDAFEICIERNKRNLYYARGILRKWKAEGKDNGKSGNGTVKNQHNNIDSILEEMEREL